MDGTGGPGVQASIKPDRRSQGAWQPTFGESLFFQLMHQGCVMNSRPIELESEELAFCM